MVADRGVDLACHRLAEHGAGKVRAVDLLPRLHQGVARERHVVLPTDQRADAADGGIKGHQAAPVPPAPDHAFVVRGHDLAALANQRAVRVEDELGVVEAAPLALVYAENHHRACSSRRASHRFGHRSRYVDGFGVQPEREIPDRDRCVEHRKVGVAGDDGLGEHRQTNPLQPAALDRLDDLLQRGVPVEKHRRKLHRSHPERLSECAHRFTSFSSDGAPVAASGQTRTAPSSEDESTSSSIASMALWVWTGMSDLSPFAESHREASCS